MHAAAGAGGLARTGEVDEVRDAGPEDVLLAEVPGVVHVDGAEVAESWITCGQ